MHRIATIAFWAFVVSLLLCTATVLIGPVMGLTNVDIKAGSMAPTYPFGTTVLVDEDPTIAYATGDVITYRHGRNTPVTHRIVAVRPDPSGNDVEYVTRGDANATDDPQPVLRAEVIGLVRGAIPYEGLVTGLLMQPHVIVFLATIAIGLSWASSRRPEGQRAGGEEMLVG